ncbi:MAG TPA: MFS transporter [Burkholderiales bacterium]|nr:MFS transporter [Burkholderiales bacterium]
MAVLMTNRAVFLLSLAAFASAASLRATDTLLPQLAAEFSVTTGGAASVVTAFAVSYGLLQAVYGPMGDRYGKYLTVCVATLASAFGTIACALAPSLHVLVIARFAAGATVGALIPLSMAWIGDVVAYEQRQATIARFALGQITGTGVGQSLAGVLAEHFGWRAIFVVLAVLYLIVGALLALELRSNPVTRHATGDATVSIRAGVARMAGLLSQRWVRIVVGTVFLEGAVMFGSLAFIPVHLQQRFSIGPALAGAMVGAYAVGGVVYALGAKRFVAGLGEGGLAAGGGLALAAGYLWLALAWAAWASVPGILLIGIGLYMLHNTLQVNATQMAPAARGAAVSLFALCLFTGQSTGVWLAGKVVDAVGTVPLFLASALGLVLLGFGFRWQLRSRPRSGHA